MPKKTKRDKLLAEERSKKQALNLVSYNFVKPQTKTNTAISQSHITIDSDLKEFAASKPQTSTTVYDEQHLKRDLIRIALFTFSALTLQVMLYYFLRG